MFPAFPRRPSKIKQPGLCGAWWGTGTGPGHPLQPQELDGWLDQLVPWLRMGCCVDRPRPFPPSGVWTLPNHAHPFRCSPSAPGECHACRTCLGGLGPRTLPLTAASGFPFEELPSEGCGISGGSLAQSLHGHRPTDTLPSWTVLTHPESSQIAQGRVARHLPDPTVIPSHAHSWNQKPGTHSPLSPTPAASIPSFYILIQSWLTPSPSSHSHLPRDNLPSPLCHLGLLSPARPASRMWSPAGNPGAHSPSMGWPLTGHSSGHELQVHRRLGRRALCPQEIPWASDTSAAPSDLRGANAD